MLILLLTLLISYNQIFSQNLSYWAENSYSDFSKNTFNNLIISEKNKIEISLPEFFYKSKQDFTYTSQFRNSFKIDSNLYVGTFVEDYDLYMIMHNSNREIIGNRLRVNDVHGYAGDVGENSISVLGDILFVTWVCNGYSPSPESRSNIYGQLYNLELEKIGNNFQINDTTNDGSRNPVVISNEFNNTFWVLYDIGNFNDGANIYVHVYDLDKRRITNKFPLFKEKFKKHITIDSIVKINKEKFIISIMAFDIPISYDIDIFYSVFDFNGYNITGPQLVNDDNKKVGQWYSDLACDNVGNILIVWRDERDKKEQFWPHNENIYGQFLNTEFKKISDNFIVNKDIYKYDFDPDVTYLNDRFCVSWTSLDEAVNLYYANEWQLNTSKSGEMISSIYDTRNNKNKYHKIFWTGYTEESTNILFQLRSSNEFENIESSEWLGPDNETNFYSNNGGEDINPIHNGNRFIQYKAVLNTDLLGKSPILNSVKISFEPSVLPDIFELYQNYPNPFNSSTTISYFLGIPEQIKLSIYDVLGKQVLILVDEFQLPNKYKVFFNAEKISSGVYYYRLQIGSSFEQTKKIIILK